MAKKIYLEGEDIKFIDGVQTTARTLTQLAQGYIDGWLPTGETWTYVSATTFTISGDKTGKYQIGDKIKLTQTTIKYFSVVEVSYSSPNTTVTITGGTDYTLADATITSPFYSKMENPQGFPSGFNFTPTLANITLGNGDVEGRFAVNGRLCLYTGYFKMGSTSAMNSNPSFSLPVNAVITGNLRHYGECEIRDVGTATFGDFYSCLLTSTVIVFSEKSGTNTKISSTVPMTWAINDTIHFSIIYEI